MRKYIITAFLGLLSAAPAMAYFSCDCIETERRVSGLEFLLNSGYGNGDAGRIQRAIQSGRNSLDQARNRDDEAQQSAICSQGNQRMNRMWVQWQPTIAQLGGDPGNGCE